MFWIRVHAFKLSLPDSLLVVPGMGSPGWLQEDSVAKRAMDP